MSEHERDVVEIVSDEELAEQIQFLEQEEWSELDARVVLIAFRELQAHRAGANYSDLIDDEDKAGFTPGDYARTRALLVQGPPPGISDEHWDRVMAALALAQARALSPGGAGRVEKLVEALAGSVMDLELAAHLIEKLDAETAEIIREAANKARAALRSYEGGEK